MQLPHRVSLVLPCALKHPPDTAVRKLEAVLYYEPCSEIANIWAARLELRSSRAFAGAVPKFLLVRTRITAWLERRSFPSVRCRFCGPPPS